MIRSKHRFGALVAIAAMSIAGTFGVASATTEPPSDDAMTEGTDAMTEGTDAMSEGTDAMSEGTDAMSEGTDAMSEGTDAMSEGTDAMAEGEMAGPAGPLCAAVPTDGEGSVEGMADDPAATAASNNPLLSTLVAAVTAAGLGDTLNGEGPFTIFAPINSAFDKVDPATLEGLLADTEALTGILTYHVIAEQLSSADLLAGGTFTTVNGAELTIAQVGETAVINGGAAAVQCADVPVANATVHLIDSVLLPPA